MEGKDGADRRPGLLKPPEVAGDARVSVHTLAVWRTKNEGPRYVKVGRFVRYRPEDVEAWLESRTRGGGA